MTIAHPARRSLAAAALVAACLATVACTSDQDGVVPDPTGTSAPPPAIATHPSPAGIGDGAILGGVLTIVDGCLYVVSGDSATLPIVPESLAVWNDGFIVEGQVLRPGDPVSMGGGYAEGVPREATIPAACDTDAMFVVAIIDAP